MQISEATKCTASVGIGPNMLLAKLATSSAKPDGVFRIHPGGDTERLAQPASPGCSCHSNEPLCEQVPSI